MGCKHDFDYHFDYNECKICGVKFRLEPTVRLNGSIDVDSQEWQEDELLKTPMFNISKLIEPFYDIGGR